MDISKFRSFVIQAIEHRPESDFLVKALDDCIKPPPYIRGDLLQEAGNILYDLHQFKLALALYSEALDHFEQINDRDGISGCHTNIGTIHRCLGNCEAAIKHNNYSLQIAKELGLETREILCYLNIGNAYSSSGNYPLAIEHQNRALQIAIKLDDKENQSKCYNNLGTEYQHLGQLTQALEYLKQSLQIDRVLSNKRGESKSLNNIGNIYQKLGQSKEAQRCYEQALSIDKEIGDTVGELICYANLGVVYNDLCQYQKALAYCLKCVEEIKATDDRSIEISCYITIGNCYNALGQADVAIENFQRAKSMLAKYPNHVSQMRCCIGLGNAYYSQGRFKDTIDVNEKVVGIANAVGDDYHLQLSRLNIANAYSAVKDYSSAVSRYEMVLKSAIDTHNIGLESKCRGNIGTACYKMGDVEKASTCLLKALDLAKAIEDRQQIMLLLLDLGLISFDDDAASALTHFKDAIELSDLMRESLVREADFLSFNEKWVNLLRFTVRTCVRLDDPAQAFQYLEKSKGQSLVEILRTGDLKSRASETTELKGLLENERELLEQLRLCQVGKASDEMSRYDYEEWDRATGELETLYCKIAKHDPEYVNVRTGRPESLAEVQTFLATLDRESIILEYFVEGDECCVFIVRRNGSVAMQRLELSATSITNLVVECCIGYLSTSHPTKNGRMAFRTLGQSLITPIEKELEDGKGVICVPYGALHYIPLHAFDMAGKPLICRNPTSYISSSTVLRFCGKHRRRNRQTALVIGVEFEEEAEHIARIWGTKAYCGQAATKASVMQMCCDKDIIHFSCHGQFHAENPLASGLILEDGILTAKEIFNLKIKAEVVVLSACETGVNKLMEGEELIGLTRAFLYAGAEAVVVSLWRVDARATMELMLEFFTEMRAGHEKSVSLQKAQIKTSMNSEFSDPYFWAGFILIGDGS